jgi:hypothetical protein
VNKSGCKNRDYYLFEQSVRCQQAKDNMPNRKTLDIISVLFSVFEVKDIQIE